MINQKKKWMKIALAAMLSLPLCSLQVHAEESANIGKQYVAEETSRVQQNFNNEWKFYLGDVENGQDVTVDDSSWTNVAIPHNFSIPYNMESSFYVGYGWYRKDFQLNDIANKRIAIEFEGVFQVAEIYVNGQAVATHEGGYTGFEYDITDYVLEGENQIAVRVNNIWQPDLAPRAGDHQFTGGIYRDVYLNITDEVHVAWYGNYVTTPDLTNPGFDESAVNVWESYASHESIMENIQKRQSNVAIETEVVNDSAEEQTIFVKHQVVDDEGIVIAEFSTEEQKVASKESCKLTAISEQIKDIYLWEPENPYLYTVYTTVYCEDVAVDTFESAFGFRWAQYRNDGFYLNGEKILLNGANVHQDHGGWADAVTNQGFSRDVAMIKEAGMNFIRGSHYPHDPSFADACDEMGILFWSENCFWGMGGCAGKDEPAKYFASDWFKDAYPQNPSDEKAFEDSCMKSLEDMIRINRNHPSIINWSMGNEVFFTAGSTQQKAKNLVSKMRDYAHLLDPTRKAGMGGVQRENYDRLEICDIAGYNGDGGKITNTWMPNVVAEYGSKTADRPGEYRPFYDQIQAGGVTDQYQLTQNSAGLSLWCAFHHGTIGGEGLAKMGMIDYYRLPLQTWYWYRENNTGVAAEQSSDGEAVQLKLTSSQNVIKNDGTEDAQIIATVLDADGKWVNTDKRVTLTVVSGPGVFPTGKEYVLLPNNTMRDGKGAIEFRSYYPGETVIRATAIGMQPAEIKLTTTNVTGVTGEEPEDFYVMPEPEDSTDKITDPYLYGTSNVLVGRPAFPSSNEEARTLATDGDVNTSWTAKNSGSGEYWLCDLEFTQYVYKIRLDFKEQTYPFKVELSMDKNADKWTTVAEYTKETVENRAYEESVAGVEARYLKITFTDVPEGEYASLSECALYGNTSSQAPQYEAEWAYLSDLEALTETTGWGNIGKDESCEGNRISVGGNLFEKGIGVHANSVMEYDLNEKYTRFRAYAGIDDEVGTNIGDAIFLVYADDKLIYEKNLKTGDCEFVDLSVSGVKKLKLVTTNNGSDSNDHTDWADAKVLGAMRDTTKRTSGFETAFTSNTQQIHPGARFEAEISLKNTESSENGYWTSLSLYDDQNTLIDMCVVNDYLSKGKTTVVPMKLDIPASLKNGSLHVNVWKAQSLEPVSQTIVISSGEPRPDDTKLPVTWTKVDGERMEKSGNWATWNSADAYEGTETYTGDTDTPLADNTSISYTFTGNGFRIGAKRDGGQKGADVYLDGKKIAAIVTKLDSNVNEYVVVYESDVLEEGEHTVTLVPTGKFGIDYIEYSTTDQSPENTKESPGESMKAFFNFIEKEDVALYTEDSRKPVSEAVGLLCMQYMNGLVGKDSYTFTAQELRTALTKLEKNVEIPEITETPEVTENVTAVFKDVFIDWYTDYVQYVYDNGLMTGIKGTTEFQPNANITKAQVAQVLYNMEEQPVIINQNVFTELKDVYQGEWYENAVAWAYGNGVVTGDLQTKKFYPNADVTREQLALMMFRYASYRKYDVSASGELAGLENAENVSNWALDGVKWAVGQGLISGIEKNGTKDLAPQGNASRAQMAAILQRFCKEYE